MPVMKKITAEEFNHVDVCVDAPKLSVVKSFKGDVDIKFTFAKYDLKIPANTYKWIVLVPCALIDTVNWVRVFNRSRRPYKTIDVEDFGLVFAF